MKRSTLSSLLLRLLFSTAAASAITAPAAALAEPTTPAATATAYAVVVRGDGLDEGAVRAALGKELGTRVVRGDTAEGGPVRGTVTVTLRRADGELAVSYDEPGRASVSRVVAAPATDDEAIRAAALLAGNLVRRQVDDLLGTEAVAPAPAAATPPPAAAVSPAPATPAAPEVVPANAALFYPLAVNSLWPEARVRFDLGLLYSEVGALEGIGLGTVQNARRGSRGLRYSWLVNRSGGAVQGADLAWAANVASGNVEGLQVALGFNVARGALQGAQATWGVNVAGDTEGVQVGLVNVAKKVKGVQLGLVNVADDVEGLPIGLVSVTKTGGVHALVWASNTSYGNLGLKFATRHTFTMLSAHVHAEGSRALGGPGFTIGGRLPLDPVTLELDVQGVHLFGDRLCCGDDGALRARDRTLAKLRASVSYQVAPRFSVFGGGGATATFTYADRRVAGEVGPEVFGGLAF